MDRSDLALLSPDEKRALLRQLVDTKPGASNGSSTDLEATHGQPLSYPQQRLWFLHQLNPASAAFNVEAVTPIHGPFDPEAMRHALSDIVARHAVLRTTFVEIDGEPRQFVDAPGPLDALLVDLSTEPQWRRTSELERLVAEAARAPFDLARGPLLRASIIRLSAYEHVLALHLHHIVADGWSMGIFGRELTALYRHHVTGEPAQLPPLTVQYTDFAAWQRDWMSGSRLRGQLDYWLRQLADLPTIELPLDRPRPPVQGDAGSYHTFTVPSRLHRRLVDLGAAEGCTLFITALSAFTVLLSRWSGQRDLPIGTYVANRRKPEFEHLVGFFLNTLVMRTRAERGCTFRQFLAAVRETALGAYDNQDVPFEFIVEAVQPTRDLSRNPLIQVVFQLNNAPTVDPRLTNLQALDFKRATSIYDLALLLFETSDGLGAQIEYSTALFESSTIERLARQFLILLDSIVDDPDASIDELAVETPLERERTLGLGNDTARRHPWHRGLVDLFDVAWRAGAERPALTCGDDVLTYDELAGRAAGLAARLIDDGIGGGDVVGVLLPRSFDAVVAILGIVKTGAAWLPLDAASPEARLTAMVVDAGASAVITAGGDTVGDVPAIELTTVGRGDPAAPDRRPQPNDRAYVLYTSGSTGRPKGVAAPHGQILNRLHWMWREYPWRAGEVAALKTSLGFVDSIWEIFGGLLQGIPTEIVRSGDEADLDALVAALGRCRASRLWLVPSLLRALLDGFPDLRARLPALDMWVASGETLPLDLYQRFVEAMPGAKLYNLYGTSEVWDATWCDPGDCDLASGRVPIGRAIDNVRVYVVDELDQPVPVGTPGELLVAGAGLVFGYLGAGADQARFRPFDAGDDVPERVFRSGDRVALRADGDLQFLGRRDTQVKIRGVRVELDEVEAAVVAHPGVGAAAVRLLDDGGDADLVAWYEQRDSSAEPRALREHLATLLPAVMIPRRLVPMIELPRTSSGKVDRTQLADPRTSVDHPPYEPPEGDVEEAVAAIWREVLAVDSVGRDDDFFADLGGHSLLATKVVGRLRAQFGTAVQLQLVFEHPTVRGLAGALTARAVTSAGPPATAGAIPRLDREAYRRRGASA